MNRLLFSIVVFVALCCFSMVAVSKERIVEFTGSESKNTAEFEVEAPWIVDWRTMGDYPGQMAVQIDLSPEVQAGSPIRIGYAFEFPTGGVADYAPFGSHEILIRYDFSYKLRSVSPAYFW